jgi:predicted RNase H-like HicB family nuclease
MPVYIALIQKDADGSFNVSFPDLPGIVTAGDTLDEAIEEAEETLEYAAGDWRNPDGSMGLPSPRTIEQLQNDPEFADAADGGTIVEIDYEAAE